LGLGSRILAGKLARVGPEVALGDADRANQQHPIRNPKEKSRIEYRKEWFQIDSDETPEGPRSARRDEYKV